MRVPGTAAAHSSAAAFERLDERLAVGARLEAQVDERLGAVGHGVLARPAGHLADVDGDAARVVGERLRAIDELRERPDRVRAFLVGVAGVRGLAVGDDRERAGALAARDDEVVLAPRLEDERARARRRSRRR